AKRCAFRLGSFRSRSPATDVPSGKRQCGERNRRKPGDARGKARGGGEILRTPGAAEAMFHPIGPNPSVSDAGALVEPRPDGRPATFQRGDSSRSENVYAATRPHGACGGARAADEHERRTETDRYRWIQNSQVPAWLSDASPEVMQEGR